MIESENDRERMIGGKTKHKKISPARERRLSSRNKLGHAGLAGCLALERRQGGRRAEQGDARAVFELGRPARRLRVRRDRVRRARARRAEIPEQQRS